jgi:hypothetical protein
MNAVPLPSATSVRGDTAVQTELVNSVVYTRATTETSVYIPWSNRVYVDYTLCPPGRVGTRIHSTQELPTERCQIHATQLHLILHDELHMLPVLLF